MNFLSMLIFTLMAVVAAKSRYSTANLMKQLAGEVGPIQLSKCDRLRYKLMFKHRNHPKLVRQIYNLDLQC